MDHAVRGILGNGLANAIDYTFRCMEIAEQEITSARRRYPRKSKRINESFLAMRPTEFVRGGEELYRRHCRELLSRVARNEDLTPGTNAEVCFTLSTATLAAPPDADHAAAYALAFVEVFPEKSDMVKGIRQEYITGRAAEIVADLRKKIGRDAKRGGGI